MLSGDVVSHDTDFVVLGQILGHATKTATYIEDFHSWLELEFSGDKIHLVDLCLVQIIPVLYILPVGAAVLHVSVKHIDVQLIAQIVVLINYLHRLRFRLLVESKLDLLPQPGQNVVPSSTNVGGQRLHHFTDVFSIPPTIHVGFLVTDQSRYCNVREGF